MLEITGLYVHVSLTLAVLRGLWFTFGVDCLFLLKLKSQRVPTSVSQLN